MFTTTHMKQFQALQETNEGYYFDDTGRLYGPNVVWSPLPEDKTQPAIIPHSMICHTNAGNNKATWKQLWSWLNSAGNTGESHFQGDMDGTLAQYMRVTVRADCNWKANSWKHTDGKQHGAVSFEMQDNGAASLNTTPYTVGQIKSLVGAGTALAVQWGITCYAPRAWNDHGIDYHSRFPYVNPWTPAWTNVKGKTCPGTARIRQMPGVRQFVGERVVAYIGRCQELGVPHGIAGL